MFSLDQHPVCRISGMEASFPLALDEEADLIEWPWVIVVSIPANCKVVLSHHLMVSPVAYLCGFT